MKKLLKIGALAYALMAFSPLPLAAAVDLPSMPEAWYDVDGDGKLEFITSGGMYKLDADNNPQTVSSFSNVKGALKLYRLSAELPLIVISSYGYDDTHTVYALGNDNKLTRMGLSEGVQYYPADCRGDGSKGLISRGGNAEFDRSYILSAAGNYYREEFSIISWNEYHGLRSEWVSSGGGLPSLSDGMFVGSGSGGTSYGDFRMLDLNGDGLSDMFDASRGRYYLNTGLGSFLQNTFGGKSPSATLMPTKLWTLSFLMESRLPSS